MGCPVVRAARGRSAAAIAASLLELPLAGGKAPELHEVLADVRWQLAASGDWQPLGAS